MGEEPSRISFTDPATQRCPFDAYERLRGDGPVYRDPVTGHFVVTGYELIKAVSLDTDRISAKAGVLRDRDGPMGELVQRVMRENGYPLVDVLATDDAPSHTFHRALVEATFSYARIRKIEDYLEGVVKEKIDALPPGGVVDIHAALSVPIPVTVIADQLGVERGRLAAFKAWSDAGVARTNPRLGAEELTQALLGYCALQNYLAERAEAYRRQPGDCLLSDLVHAEVDGRRLSVEELIGISSLLIVAGNETTTSAISSALLMLAKDPALQAKLRADNAAIADFVEEVLRLESPVQGMFRRPKVDMELAGVPIPAGSVLRLTYGAANRDPARFARPADVDLGRPNGRQHITFGYGPHFCIGHQLARSELRITLTRFLERTTGFSLADEPDPVTYMATYVAYGPERLRIQYEKQP